MALSSHKVDVCPYGDYSEHLNIVYIRAGILTFFFIRNVSMTHCYRRTLQLSLSACGVHNTRDNHGSSDERTFSLICQYSYVVLVLLLLFQHRKCKCD